jgi:hypothetical protein
VLFFGKNVQIWKKCPNMEKMSKYGKVGKYGKSVEINEVFIVFVFSDSFTKCS